VDTNRILARSVTHLEGDGLTAPTSSSTCPSRRLRVPPF